MAGQSIFSGIAKRLFGGSASAEQAAPVGRRRGLVARDEGETASASGDFPVQTNPGSVMEKFALAQAHLALRDDGDDADAPPRPAWLDAAERQAIVFRQLVPLAEVPALSFYGGVPIAPAGFRWPEADGTGAPLSFVMQIDLGAIPRGAGLGLLPEQGILYVFMDLATSASYRFVYEPAPDSSWREAEVPTALGAAYGDNARFFWPWIDAHNDSVVELPRIMPKWPFAPVAVDLGAPAPFEDDEDEDYAPRVRFWPETQEVAAALLAAEGRKVVSSDYRPVPAVGVLQRPYAAYPHDWRAVSILSAKLLERLRRRYFADACRRRGLSAEETEQLSARHTAMAQDLYDRSHQEDPFALVPRPDADTIWEWLGVLDGLNYIVLKEAAVEAIEASLGHAPEAAAAWCDDDALALIAGRHVLAMEGANDIWAAIPDRMLAPPCYVQGYIEEIGEHEVLLLQIASNQPVGHNFGEGVYQFTISPEDLQAQRFDRVRLTCSAY